VRRRRGKNAKRKRKSSAKRRKRKNARRKRRLLRRLVSHLFIPHPLVLDPYVF
jgi:hypothetical protein